MSVRVALVDDEAPARSELRFLLSRHSAIEVVGEAANAAEALTLVLAGCDAIFLDIEMPGLTGIDAARLIRSAHEPPAVVFVTAHAGYAVEAFAVEAFDYLLKPVDPERLSRVVERLLERSHSESATAPPARISVVAGGGVELIDWEAIHFAVADGDYCRVHTSDRSYLCAQPLGDLEAELPSERFARIHRSTLVNLAHVAAVRRVGSDRLKLVLDDATRTELDVARRQSARLRERLNL
ncbi:MAG: response regulator [Actinobacteria bacterium]|uniref:Unannotated protein n=1 Tax=freshwater metagenome TaxID=449393 RepID=A0A6J6NC62_9ZZZZ|nr:response regulator [Actinomycetota bacterium]